MEKLKINDIRKKARDLGVTFAKTAKKTDLIRGIQAAEGNCQCFATSTVSSCGQEQCSWRADCLDAAC